MSSTSVPAHARSAVGKGPNRRLRASGLIPAVVYGGAGGSRALSVSPQTLVDIIRSPRGVNTIFSLDIDGEPESESVMIHDYQLDPISHSLLHADLLRVEFDRVSDWSVSILLEGQAAGVKRGGNLDFVTRSLTVACRPRDIPEHITLRVSDADWGDTIRASSLELPDGIRLASDPDLVVVHVSPPKGAESDEDEAAEAPDADADADA